MRFNPIKLLEGLLCTAPALLLTLAACGGGGGGNSNTMPTMIPGVAPTVAPTVGTPTNGCYSVNLYWSAVTGATGYNVYRAASSVGVISAGNKLTATPDTATSYTDTSATSTTRYYQVTAVNSTGEGPGSNVVSGATTGTCTKVGGSVQGNPLTLSTAVSTMAGTAGKGGLVDGTGASAQFKSPRGVTTDGTNLYVADTSNNAIRKIVIATGAVSTLAGSSTGLSGNTDNPALFSGPQGITTDGTYLYVADTGNGSIRTILISTGAVSTINVSNTFNLPAAITYDGTNLYVADTGNGKIVKENTAGAPDTAFSVNVTSPQGITTDGTTLYITSSNSIQTIGIVGGTPTTLVVASGLNVPQGITTDGVNLYIANSGDHTIRTIPKTGTALNTIAGTVGIPGSTDATLGTNARFNTPGGITTDGTNLYITDTGNQTIRKIQ